MLGGGGIHLGLIGGVETMSRVPVAIKPDVAQRLLALFTADPAQAAAEFRKITASDFDLPVNGWANRSKQP